MGMSWTLRWAPGGGPRGQWPGGQGPRRPGRRASMQAQVGGQGAPGRLSDRPGRLLLDGRRRAGTASHTKPLGFRRRVERRVI